jgi:large subunit ribosomal protein L33
MAKANKETMFLVSSAGSGSTYTFRRNKKKMKGEKKLSFKKYDPRLRKHVEFSEKKLSKLKKRFKMEGHPSQEAES